MSEELTFCVNCKNHKLCGSDVWYNHFCLASPNEKIMDFVRGKEEYQNNKFEYCKEVNIDGHCEKYQKKGR